MSLLVFSERQKSILTAAVTTLSLVVLVWAVIKVASLILTFFVYFSGIFLPLAVAAIMATLMKPYYNWLETRLHNKIATLMLVFLSILVPLTFVFVYFGSLILNQLSDFLNELPVWIERAQLFIAEKMPAIRGWIAEHNLKGKITALLEGRVEFLMGSAAMVGKGFVSTGAAFFNTITGLLGWVVLPVYFIFIIQAPFITGKDIEKHLPFLKPETRRDVVYLFTEFAGIIITFFRGQMIVAMCQGLLYATGFAVVGLKHGIVLGFILGMLNVIPYLGNIIGLAVVLPLAWFQPDGGLGMLFSAITVFVIVQIVEGYFLTPRIMGKSTGLHPMTIIVAILFWGAALNGLLGMLLAIPLTAFLVVLWRLMKSKYIKEWI